MIVKDFIGNTLHEGDLLLWKATGLLVSVSSIEPGGITDTKGRKTPARLVLRVELPFDPSKPMAGFQDFVRVVDPDGDPAALSAPKLVAAGEN